MAKTFYIISTIRLSERFSVNFQTMAQKKQMVVASKIDFVTILNSKMRQVKQRLSSSSS